MLGLNKPLVPLIIYSIMIYSLSFIVPWAWALMPLVMVPYVVCSTKWYADRIYGPGEVFPGKRMGALSGVIPKSFIKFTSAMWCSPFIDAAARHEEGHVLGNHQVLSLGAFLMYAITIGGAIRFGFSIPQMVAIIVGTLISNYAMQTAQEVVADKYASRLGHRTNMVLFLRSHASRSICNRIRIWALKKCL